MNDLNDLKFHAHKAVCKSSMYDTLTDNFFTFILDLFEIDNDGLIKLATTISVQSHKNMFDLTIVANDSLNINNVSQLF